MLNMILTVTLS